MSRSRRFVDGFKRVFRVPSPSPGAGPSKKRIATQSLAVSASMLASLPHSSYSESSAIQMHISAALTATDNVTSGGSVTPVPSGSAVWAEALRIAKTKLGDSLPVDITDLTSHSAKGNIEAVITELEALQKDDMKKRWSYTWRGKKVIIVECVGKILKSVEYYSKVVDTAIQSNPQVSALVWAGVRAIMQVRI